MNRNPKKLFRRMKSRQLDPKMLKSDFMKINKGGRFADQDFEQWVTSWTAMILFPFITGPIITELLFEGKKKAYKQYLNERRTFLKKMISLIDASDT